MLCTAGRVRIRVGAQWRLLDAALNNVPIDSCCPALSRLLCARIVWVWVRTAAAAGRSVLCRRACGPSGRRCPRPCHGPALCGRQDTALFSVTKEALGRKTSPTDPSQTVGPRDVSTEPMYVALSHAGPRAPGPPSTLEVDYVRLYHNPQRHSFGCDAPRRPTARYIAENPGLFGVPRCGNGRCEAGECAQCPRDCLDAAACRQDCRVPRCQVRDGRLTARARQWAFRANGAAQVLADMDWRAGDRAATLTVHRPGASPTDLSVSQSGLLLCEGFRYRVSATLRARRSEGPPNGRVAVAVTGGEDNGHADLLPEPLVVSLGADAVTVARDFEVRRRWGRADVALYFGAHNDDHAIEIAEVSVCPVPSRAQYCGAGPRQRPATPLQTLLRGDGRVVAAERQSGRAALGHTRFVRRSLPRYSAVLRSELDAERRPQGRAFFWPHATGPGHWTVEYAVVHSAQWTGPDRVQAIAVHTAGSDGRPARANLLAPLYCNADVPLPPGLSALDCREWPVRDAPPGERATTTANFTATRTVWPESAAYDRLNPLSGRVLLTDREYADIRGGLASVVLYLENDRREDERVVGSVRLAARPSCLGGLVFEYTDEWWKVWGVCGAGGTGAAALGLAAPAVADLSFSSGSADFLPTGGGEGCITREGTAEAVPAAVRQAVGGGCQSGWGRLLSVTNAVEAGTWRQGDSGWV